MKYEWDKNKEKTNIDKHGFSFSLAKEILDANNNTRIDARRDYGETRYVTVGILETIGRLMVVTYTKRNGNNRIISFRKANAREQKQFDLERETENAT